MKKLALVYAYVPNKPVAVKKIDSAWALANKPYILKLVSAFFGSCF